MSRSLYIPNKKNVTRDNQNPSFFEGKEIKNSPAAKHLIDQRLNLFMQIAANINHNIWAPEAFAFVVLSLEKDGLSTKQDRPIIDKYIKERFGD